MAKIIDRAFEAFGGKFVPKSLRYAVFIVSTLMPVGYAVVLFCEGYTKVEEIVPKEE